MPSHADAHIQNTALTLGGGHPGDGPRAHGGGQGGGQGLKRGQAPFSALLPAEQPAQSGPQPEGQAEQLKKAGAQGVNKPREQKQPQQPGVPKSVRRPTNPRHSPHLRPKAYAGGEKNRPEGREHKKAPAPRLTLSNLMIRYWGDWGGRTHSSKRGMPSSRLTLQLARKGNWEGPSRTNVSKLFCGRC